MKLNLWSPSPVALISFPYRLHRLLFPLLLPFNFCPPYSAPFILSLPFHSLPRLLVSLDLPVVLGGQYLNVAAQKQSVLVKQKVLIFLFRMRGVRKYIHLIPRHQEEPKGHSLKKLSGTMPTLRLGQGLL